MVLAAMVRTATTATTATKATTAAMAATEGKQNPTTVCTAEKEAAQHRPGRCWPMLLLPCWPLLFLSPLIVSLPPLAILPFVRWYGTNN